MHSLKNENGMTIVTVIMILALVTLAGVMVTKTTSTELQIATGDQLHKVAFYAAEASQSYVMFNNDLYGPANIDSTAPVNYPDDANPNSKQVLETGSDKSFNGEVGYQNSMVVPRGSGFQVGKFKAHVYQMSCNGYGPRDTGAQIEIGFYRVGF
jgi:hypothetical protein